MQTETNRSKRNFLANPIRGFSTFSRSPIHETKFFSEAREVNGTLVHWRQLAQAKTSLKQPLQHAVEHAKKLALTAKKNNLPLKLFLSGGIDSEAMAEAFLLAEVGFEAVIGRYDTDMNEHDYCTAITFCNKHNIKMNFIDVNVFEFLESGKALKYANELGCRSPQIAVHLHMLEQVQGYCVLGGNPIFPIFKNVSEPERLKKEMEEGNVEISKFYGLPGQTQSVYLRFFEKRNKLGEPFFFQSSPELCMSFLNLDEMITSLASGEGVFDYKMKCTMYQLGGFSAKPRQGKFTGFEKYRAEYDKRMNTEYGIGFNEKFRKPLEELTTVLPQVTSFILPYQVANKFVKNLAVGNTVVVEPTRRVILQRCAALFGGLTIVSLFPSIANAADPCCCGASGPFPVYDEKECAALCAPGSWEISPVCN